MTGVLEGIKVVDMGHFVAIPSAGAILGDWGADVIKVEPLTGEATRGARERAEKMGLFHVQTDLHNRNKRAMAVDLKNDRGKDIIYKLVEGADIFISNYQGKALSELKMDYDTLSRFNPGLIYATVTGFGTIGEDKDKPGFDLAARARAGMQCMKHYGMMDRTTGGYTVAGVLGALRHRDKTGEGQKLELCLFHTAVWTMAPDIQNALMGNPPTEYERAQALNPLACDYTAGDGRTFRLQMLQADIQWPGFCRAIEKPELENDPRFNSLEARGEHCNELVGMLDEIFATRDLEEWEKRFRENDCIFSRFQTHQEVITDPQALANDFFSEIDHPGVGKMKLVNSPVKFCQNPATIRTAAPEIGQHTEEVLLELDYTWDDIAQFKDQGVIL